MKVMIAAVAPQPTGVELTARKETAASSAFAALLAQKQTGKLPVEEGIERSSQPEGKKPRITDEWTEPLWLAASAMHVGAANVLNAPPAAAYNDGEALAADGESGRVNQEGAGAKALAAAPSLWQRTDENSGLGKAAWLEKQIKGTNGRFDGEGKRPMPQGSPLIEGAGKEMAVHSNEDSGSLAPQALSLVKDTRQGADLLVPFSAAGRSPFASTVYGPSSLPHREDARQLHGPTLVSTNLASLTSFVPAGHEAGAVEAENESSFVEQVARAWQFSRWVKLPNGVMQLVIRLHPEHLGTVTVKMAQEGGKLTARLLVATDAAEELIRTHLPQLVQLLDAGQVTVEKWTVWSDYDSAALPPHPEQRRDGRQQGGSRQEQKREQSPSSAPFELDGAEADG
ncbi:Flagellar hook-length control protein FliK [Geobacillus sp. 12AMOR1]|nr:Flagellar hook-length control protein FliK [Geobacillus sp. 12AMOR1]